MKHLKTLVQLFLPDGRYKELKYPIEEMDEKVSVAFRHSKLNGKKITKEDVLHHQIVMNLNTGAVLCFTINFTCEWNVFIRVSSYEKKFPEIQTLFKNVSFEETSELVGHYTKLFLN